MFSLLQSCGGGETVKDAENKDYRGYYFPMESLAKPKVYHFSCDDREVGDLFWKMNSYNDGDELYLKTDSYQRDSSGKMVPVEYFTESIRDNGAFAEEMTTFETDERGEEFQIEVTNRIKRLFFWEWDVNTPAVWMFVHESERFAGYDREVRRERNFTEQHAAVRFQGKDHKAVVFTDLFRDVLIDQETRDRESYQFVQRSVYAEGIGLYQYTRFFPGGSSITFTLKSIYSLDEWEKMQPVD